MANKYKFISGEAHWASLINPNTKFEPSWQIDVTVDEDTKEELEALGLDVKHKEEYGDYIKLKRKCVTRKGDERDAPTIVDSKRNPWNGALIGNGSKVNVKFHAFDYNYNGKTGVSAELDSVQVVELVSYGEDFGDVDDGYVIGADAAEGKKDEWDDEVPF
jgi:hypothetical protein